MPLFQCVWFYYESRDGVNNRLCYGMDNRGIEVRSSQRFRISVYQFVGNVMRLRIDGDIPSLPHEPSYSGKGSFTFTFVSTVFKSQTSLLKFKLYDII